MKKQSIGKKLTAVLLTLVLLLSMLPATALAAEGEVVNVATGLTGNIDTSDTISLPIQIMDYEADGMLFEFAEAYANVSGKNTTKKDEDGNLVDNYKTAVDDFGATFAADFTSASSITNSMCYDLGHATRTLKTGTYANYMHATYIRNGTEAPFTAYGRSGAIIPNDLGGKSLDSIRYLVLVYRSNVETGNIGFFVERTEAGRSNTKNRVGDLPFTNEGEDGKGSKDNWTYAIYDLKQGNLANSWKDSSLGTASAIWTTFPMENTTQYIDIAHVALFSNTDQAKAFGEYALTDGSDRGDNRGFGLLRGSRTQNSNGTADNGQGSAFAGIFKYNNTSAEYGNAAATVHQIEWKSGAEQDASAVTKLGYKLLGIYGEKSITNIGLLESAMGKNGYPVYKEEVVTYLAYLLQHSLEIPERTTDGWKNYRYVKGTASDVYGGTDLATALRNRINKTLGSYADTKATVDSGKKLVGTWAECQANINSYFDAAYFLLNSIFVEGSYNVPQNYYNYLVLSAGTDTETGDKTYVFDGGFVNTADPNTSTLPAINYNTKNGTIQNTSAAGKAQYYYNDDSDTTLNPFLPITDRNNEAGRTKSPYYQDDGVINGVKQKDSSDSLKDSNFGFAISSQGEFVYHADDELFFEFEGDDDVYLFINNELVLDLGAAHSISSIRFKLNDYVNAAKAGTLGNAERNKALALEEGETYEFKFYYMERHSYGSNIRIATNIRVTDPSMVTAKTSWQDGVQLDFGSIVDKDKVVEYGFTITNNAEGNGERLHNLTFKDANIGVELNASNKKALTVTGSRVTDVNGGTLDASDLSAVISHPDYDDITVTFADDAALKAFLTDLTADGTEAGGGLYQGATVTIRGIGYKLSPAEITAGVFDNTVLTTATNKYSSKTLQGQATMRVFVPADPMYYQWAGHELKIEKKDLINDILAAAKTEGNLLAGKVPNLTTSNVNKIELVTKAGNAISSPYVTIDGSYNLTVNYDTPGSKVFYVKVTYNKSANTVIVPVLINVTNVTDSVYVLDYGLKVDLTANKELTKNDALTVPGRTTDWSILGIGSNGKYSPNEITFTKDTDGVIAGKDGTFTLSGQNLTYLPNSFMEELDTIQVAMNVYEKDITPSGITGTLDINKEVEMFKDITVLPANVVYYEDCFPAITYTKQNVNDVNIFKQLGSTDNLTQSNDQDSNYGSDPSYADDVATSAGTLTTIKIDTYTPEASFTFSGTGFELIGRTNATDSATLIVSVKKGNQVVKTIPVITEFDNHNDGGTEEIYQVPVVRVKDLDYAAYTVTISGVPAYNYNEDGSRGDPKTTYLYVDGLRIFQPLEDQSNYDDDEKNATFVEIRDLVVKGDAAVVDYDGSAITVNSGFTTWVEHYNDGSYSGDGAGNTVYKGGVYEGNEVTSVDDYLVKGPNNELYINGEYEDKALVFYVQDDGDANTKGRLQIAVRGIDRGLFIGAGATGVEAMLYYGVKDGNSIEWKELTTIETATEQYITVPYQECPYDEVVVNGTKVLRYQVAIKVGMPDGTGPDGMVSFSTLKCTDMTIKSIGGPAATLYYNNGILTELASSQAVSAANYPAFSALSAQMRSTEILESVPTDENGLVTAPGGNDDEGSIPVVMGRPGYEDMIAQLLAN